MSGTAIVTGSDSGIGKATAIALAEDGFDVGVTLHEDERGARGTADEIRMRGRRVEVRQVDLAELPDAAGLVDDLADALGGLDVLVNNAGVGVTRRFSSSRSTPGGEPSRWTSTRRSCSRSAPLRPCSPTAP